MPIIAPSMLSADFLNLGRDIEMVNNSEADWFHLDIMDGRFVPNISYGMSIIAQMKKAAKKTKPAAKKKVVKKGIIAKIAKKGSVKRKR